MPLRTFPLAIAALPNLNRRKFRNGCRASTFFRRRVNQTGRRRAARTLSGGSGDTWRAERGEVKTLKCSTKTRPDNTW